jgi:hypothetical protein
VLLRAAVAVLKLKQLQKTEMSIFFLTQVLLRAAVAVLKLMLPQILKCQTQEDLFNLLKSKGTLTLEKGKKIEVPIA